MADKMTMIRKVQQRGTQRGWGEADWDLGCLLHIGWQPVRIVALFWSGQVTREESSNRASSLKRAAREEVQPYRHPPATVEIFRSYIAFSFAHAF